MADDITLPGAGVVVDTAQQSDGSHRQRMTLADMSANLTLLLELLSALPLAIDPSTGRLRVLIDPIGGAQTLGTITTVGTVTGVTTVSTVTACTTVGSVTNVAQVGSIQASGQIQDAMAAAWALNVRARIS